MRYLTFAEDLELHRRVVAETGGATALRDLGALESAIVQPRASFAGNDLYPSLEEKAAALAFSLIQNHPFVDGNKRAGHAALETLSTISGLRRTFGHPTPKVDPCKSSYRKAYSVLSLRLCPHCDWITGFFVLPDKRLNLTARMRVFDLSPVC